MYILHGTWIPEDSDRFIQGGQFYLWVETDVAQSSPGENAHPNHLSGAALAPAQFLPRKSQNSIDQARISPSLFSAADDR
jgi:hypothetical protein